MKNKSAEHDKTRKVRSNTDKTYIYLVVVVAAYVLFISQLSMSAATLGVLAMSGGGSSSAGLVSLSAGASESEVVSAILPQDNDINRPYSWKGSPVTLTVTTPGNGYDMLVDMDRSIAVSDLTTDQAARYKNLIKDIYHPCCGAPISGCGCKHAVAGKGIVKKLLQEGWSDDQIQDEVFLWYRFFWPKHYATMATYLVSQGADPSELSAAEWLSSKMSTQSAGRAAAAQLKG